jgi:hydroxybutyrate-dimer hydrolase
VSLSPSTFKQDFNLDGALCLRKLLTGSDAASLALQKGVDETRRSGDLQRKPAIIVHGRDDALLPVNHTSRPYTALNKRVEGQHSRLSYIEVTNAQHFDTFIGLPAILPGYDTRYVPLHVYLNRALDAMYAHLRHGAPLPASQVVRTVPRGGVPGAAPAITEANVPPILRRPAAADAITAAGHNLNVPD